MKKVTIIFVMLSVNVLAQEAKTNEQNEKQLRVSFEKVSMRYENMTLTKKDAGDLEITGSQIHVSGPVYVDIRDKKASRDTAADWTIVAHKVCMSGASIPGDLKADLLNYNEKVKTGFLTGNVRTLENRTEKKVGEKAILDFNNDVCKIVTIK